MQIAEVLSDLTSLRVCDPAAALALVSARPAPSPSAEISRPVHDSGDDADLKRAKDLVELHYAVKVAHVDGTPDRGLMEAREAVRRAVGGV